MADVQLDNVASGFNLTKINSNFTKIATAINDEILHRSGGNNTMLQVLDSNSNRIINLPEPVLPTDAARLQDVIDLFNPVTGDASNEFVTTTGSTTPRKLKDRFTLNVKDFGAIGDGVTDDTVAIQAAIDYAWSVGTNFGFGLIEPNPRPNAQVGQYPTVFFPHGRYEISDELYFRAYNNFEGKGAIIHQTDPTKDIFTSDFCYLNSWVGLKLVGGRTQIRARNGYDFGLEACILKIDNCDFTASYDYSVQFFAGVIAGGEQISIIDSRFTNFAQAVYSEFDVCSVERCWVSTSGQLQPNDTAWFNCTRMNVSNCMFVPISDYNVSGNTCRYFDIVRSVVATGNRFGAEGPSGLPIVYCYNDATLDGTYPYQQGDVCILRDNHLLYAGGPDREDFAVVNLVKGIFKTILIEGNCGSADGPYIRTDLMEGTTFAAYMATLTGPNNRLHVTIKNNQKWAASLTDSPASTELLLPYMNYDVTEEGVTTSYFSGIGFQPSAGAGTTPVSNRLTEYEHGTYFLTFVDAVGFGGVTGFTTQQNNYSKVGKSVTMSGGLTPNGSTAPLAVGDYIRVNGVPFGEEDVTLGTNQHAGQALIYDSIGGKNMASGICMLNNGTSEMYIFVMNVVGTVPANSNITYSLSYVEDFV